MNPQPSVFSLAIRAGLTSVSTFTAKLAGYLAAQPTRTTAQATRINTNPNSASSQWERVRMIWDGESIVKNSDFGANYVQKRRMYTTNGATYAPDTGDAKRDEDLLAYLNETWKTMGENCSMLDAFSRTADVELPMRGDSGLRWYRDMSGLRLLEFQADRLGELYQFYTPEVQNGMTYFAGIFLQGADMPNPGRYAAFKIYERADQSYTNSGIFPASDIIFFKDDLMAGIRGITKFAQCLPIVDNRDGILYSTMQTMRQQSKIAAIASNNSGQPDELSYDTETNNDGTVSYVERYGDGPVIRYQFNGDSYQVLKAEHPSTSFQVAMDKLDMHGSLSVGFPYEFLFTPSDSGGAPSRFSFEVASKEILRLRNNVYRPKLDIVSYVTIMDAIERKKFRPVIAQNKSTGRWENTLTRGAWNFGTLPSADAFRDSKADREDIWAGVKTRNDVTTANMGKPFATVLRQSTQEAIEIAMAVETANTKLTDAGFKPVITSMDIAQNSANPQQAANAQAIDENGKTIGDGKPQAVAKFAEFYESELAKLNCGTGKGGFKEGNTCASDDLKIRTKPLDSLASVDPKNAIERASQYDATPQELSYLKSLIESLGTKVDRFISPEMRKKAMDAARATSSKAELASLMDAA